MPRYESPSSSPSPVNRRSRRGRRSRSRSSSRSLDREAKEESVIKTSLVFLGSVVAATFCAHRFWPKGVTYGGKEDWEIQEVRRIRKNLHDERRTARRAEPPHPPLDRERRTRYSDRDGPRPHYVDDRETHLSDGPRGARYGRSRDRDRDRDLDRDFDRHSERSSSYTRAEPSAAAFVERRHSHREAGYYPPAPQRYRIAAAAADPDARGPPRSRRSSVERRPRRYADDDFDDDGDGREPEYVYERPAPPRSRRASVDDHRERRRYSRDMHDY